ncbi:MAG: hypothetical protein K5756_04410 [Clostridiales bacterium]|nr:hypothetical protein [Clostridiales bacterium]
MKDFEVYRDDRYVLGCEDEIPYLKINGEKYRLTCHPYEPCLYITDRNGRLTVVHNAFDPSDVLRSFSKGLPITSVTGAEYNAPDFCKMVEYSAGMGSITISDAEKVFGERAKANDQNKRDDGDKKPSASAGRFFAPDSVSIIENDPFYAVSANYPDNVIDCCLVKNEAPYRGVDSHWAALMKAALRIIADDWELRLDAGKITASRITPAELFAPIDESSNELNYRKAFMFPPCPHGYTGADFKRLNDVLFPNGKDFLEIFKWSTDWSEYFDDGSEWWGTLCLTVYDKSLDRFAVIMASATD